MLTTDQDAVRKAGRAMLQIALSCRENMTNSGIVARIAGDARSRLHAGHAPPDQGHRAAGAAGRAPFGPPGVCSMRAVPQNGAHERMRGSARASHRRLSPRVNRRSKPVSVPLRIPASPSRRARAPVMTGEAPSARAASVSLRSRASRGVRGRAVPTPVSVDRTRGSDAGTEPAAVPRGTTEGMKRCPDSSLF